MAGQDLDRLGVGTAAQHVGYKGSSQIVHGESGVALAVYEPGPFDDFLKIPPHIVGHFLPFEMVVREQNATLESVRAQLLQHRQCFCT